MTHPDILVLLPLTVLYYRLTDSVTLISSYVQARFRVLCVGRCAAVRASSGKQFQEAQSATYEPNLLQAERHRQTVSRWKPGLRSRLKVHAPRDR